MSARPFRAPCVETHLRLMRRLSREGKLDRELEFLPTDRQIRDRLAHQQGLTQPELAVLFGYTKIDLSKELIETRLPDEPYLQWLAEAYFPTPLRERFEEQVVAHALRREIVTTMLVNDTVNIGGSTFVHRMKEETGASSDEIVRAHTAARAIFGQAAIWDEVETLDNQVSAEVQTRIRLLSRRLVERGARWLLNNRPQPLQLTDTIELFSERVSTVWSQLPKLLRGEALTSFQDLHGELTTAGVPAELSERVAGISSAFPALDVVAVADRTDRDLLDVAEVYYDLGDRLGITRLQTRIGELPRADRWQSMARAAIREDLYAAHQLITADVLSSGARGATPEQRFAAWEEKNAAVLGRALATLEEIQSSESFDLAILSVAMRTMRSLLRSNR